MIKVCVKCHAARPDVEFDTYHYNGHLRYRNDCKWCRAKYGRLYRKKNRKLLAKKWALYRRNLKTRVLGYYSNDFLRCRCCGECEFSFLSLDHIKGRGEKDRRLYGVGSTFYLSIIRRGFPKGFQVLCQNCQFGKLLNGGFCPHHPETDLRKPCKI